MILRKLNEKNIPSIAAGTKSNCSKEWKQQYIESILGNPAVYGETQVFKIVNGKSVADGQPIPKHFPPVISEEVFEAVQVARGGRHRCPGRAGTFITNLFSGMLFEAKSGAKMSLANSSQRDKARGVMKRLASYDPTLGVFESWDYDQFEKCFLSIVKEIAGQQLAAMPKRLNPLPALTSQLEKVVGRIAAARKKMSESEDEVGRARPL
jgi:hypothetical protein